jgi:zinc finger protein GLI2
MEMSAPATAVEKKEAKSGTLEGSGFPDPSKKACPLAVAAAAAVAAQGGTLCFAHLASRQGCFSLTR